jgi:hypothetical protein
MATVNEVLNALNKLQSNLDQIVDDTIEETKQHLTDDIKEQLFAGTDATGNKITPRYKNAGYAAKKAQLNAKPGLFTPDLRLSGALYQGLFTIQYEENILIGSSVDYSLVQEERYSIKVFEPNQENLNDFVREEFRPTLVKKIEALSGLKFG